VHRHLDRVHKVRSPCDQPAPDRWPTFGVQTAGTGDNRTQSSRLLGERRSWPPEPGQSAWAPGQHSLQLRPPGHSTAAATM
jgi:hypothetical protein